MNQDVLARLRRLGVVKGARHLNSYRSPASPVVRQQEQEAVSAYAESDQEDPRPLGALLPGLERVETVEGGCFILDRIYPLQYQHGAGRLADLLAFAPEPAALFCNDRRLAGLNFRDFLFLDTETTGLGGAGTLAFMVGVAFFEGDAFIVRQYFLQDHGDEPAMLELLDELVAGRAGLITFNGRSFDLPLLDNRFVMNRMIGSLLEQPHIDLLPPARRLWRNRFQSCALGSLEQKLLGLQRTHDDVPGWAIPGIYNDYLRTGNGRGLTRIFYHNQIDMLSMVTLAAHIIRQFERPEPGDHPMDLLGLGRWQIKLGLVAEAEQSLRQAAVPDLPTALYQQALTHLGTLLRRSDRREEAVAVWQQLACTSFDDVTAHVELAKHYEWHEPDLAQAREWTMQALALAEDQTTRSELQHRLERLEQKMEAGSATIDA